MFLTNSGQNAADPATADGADIRARIGNEETAHLLGTLKSSALVRPFLAAVVIICLTGRFYGTPVPVGQLAIWVGLLLVIALVDLGLGRWLQRSGALPGSPLHNSLSMAMGLLLGAGWSSFGWLTWNDDPLNRFSILTLMLAVMTTLVAGYVTQVVVFQTALAVLVLPTVARFLLAGDSGGMAMGFGLLIIYPWIGFMSWRLMNTHRKSQALRFENEALAKDLEHARDEAVLARLKAEHANRAKSDFLSNMSHELRTPLNAVIGFSELLHSEASGPLSSYQREQVGDINEAGRHLLTLINDILDLSKIEAGKVELAMDEVDLEDVIDGALRLVEVRARAANITLARVPETTDVTLWVDRVRLKQVLINLLSNAVKFSHEGGTVTVEVTAPGDGTVRIDVVDQGIGMVPEDVPGAFEAFRQLDSLLERQREGTGLGLPLTRQLVELHGGTIRLETALGKGTRAIVELPGVHVFTRTAGSFQG